MAKETQREQQAPSQSEVKSRSQGSLTPKEIPSGEKTPRENYVARDPTPKKIVQKNDDIKQQQEQHPQVNEIHHSPGAWCGRLWW